MLLVSCIACYKLFVSVRVYFYLLLLRNLLRIFNNVSFDNFLTLNQFFLCFKMNLIGKPFFMNRLYTQSYFRKGTQA